MAKYGQFYNESIIYNPAVIKKGIENAKEYCKEKDIPLTLVRVCSCIGIDRKTMLELVNGGAVASNETEEEKKKRERSVMLLKRVHTECNADLEDCLATGRGTVGNIFLGKNNYGYVDKVEVNTTEKVIFCGENDMQD